MPTVRRMVVPALVLALVLTACAVAVVPAPAGSPRPAAVPTAPPEWSPPQSGASPAASGDVPSSTPAPGGGSASPPSSTVPSASPAAPSVGPVPNKSYPPTWLPPVGELAPLVRSGSRAYPVVALTIDDCWSPSAVLADLAILEAEHVNATFFPVGQAVEAYPWVWRQVGAAGFPVGNHTYDHVDLSRSSYEHVVWDIRHDDEVVARTLGRPLLPLLRPPGGASNAAVLTAAAATGQRAVVDWDVTLGDTGRGDVAELVANGVRGVNGSIVLMHANHALTQQALPAIIASYRARGFSFVTLGQLFGVPGAVPFPPATSRSAPSPTPGPTSRPTARPAPVPTQTATPAPSTPAPSAPGPTASAPASAAPSAPAPGPSSTASSGPGSSAAVTPSPSGAAVATGGP